MKKVIFLTAFISIFGFSQEKFTTQDFGLHKNTETVISKQYWEDDQSNIVFTEELKFYNTFLEEQKTKDGDYVTVKKYYYNIDNLLVKIETEHVHSGEKEKEVFHYKNLQLHNSELWMHDKMFSKTQYFFDKNNRLTKEIEKDAKNKVTRIVEYKNYKNDDFFTKLIKDFQNGKVVETTEEIYENKLLVEANYEMYNLKTNVKNTYNKEGRIVKEVLSNSEVVENTFTYEVDEKGNPTKVTKTNSQNQGNYVLVINNTYSTFPTN